MSYLGLVPSEHSSGNERRQGAITRAGNGHVRRILTEAAWAYRHRPFLGRSLRKRGAAASDAVREIAWRAQGRLCAKRQKLLARGKPSTKAATAVARGAGGVSLVRGTRREAAELTHIRTARTAGDPKPAKRERSLRNLSTADAVRSTGDRGSPRRITGHAVSNPRISGPIRRRLLAPLVRRFSQIGRASCRERV